MSQLQQFTAIVIKAVFVKFEKFHIGEEEKTLEKKVKLYAEVELSAQGYDRDTHTHTHTPVFAIRGRGYVLHIRTHHCRPRGFFLRAEKTTLGGVYTHIQ